MSLFSLLTAASVVQQLPPPPLPPIGPVLERRAVIIVKADPSLKNDDALQFVLTIRNDEKRAYCIPSDAFHTGRQTAPYDVSLSDTDGNILEFAGDVSGITGQAVTTFVAIPPGQSVTHTIYAGRDYRFPVHSAQYVATFAVAGAYCDELNLGYPSEERWRGANLIFTALSASFTR